MNEPSVNTHNSKAKTNTKLTPEIPGVRFLGWDSIHGRHVAAIVERPVARDVLASIYRRLVPDARQQILKAKRMGVWGVLATDVWAIENR